MADPTSLGVIDEFVVHRYYLGGPLLGYGV